ncbi:MAG: HlyD family efflux transporter periplasmic adaptor subunit [Bacteroidota bacterium]
MLNISSRTNKLPDGLKEYQNTPVGSMPKAGPGLRVLLLASLLLGLIFAFLPWTQNVQAKGTVTTLLPQDRPQRVNTIIDAQVVSWKVREGQLVQRGDTLAQLAEVKPEYLDPDLVDRTNAQADAVENSAAFFLNKSEALTQLANNLRDQLALAQQQIDANEQQALAEINTQEAAIENARQQLGIAETQLIRTDSLFQIGNRSQADVEEKRRKQQAELAKLTEEQNKLVDLQNELEIIRLDRDETLSDFRTQINKAESDRFSALSNYQTALGTQQELEIQAESYARRSDFYHVIAPQTGVVSEMLVPGLGETVKAGEALLTIVPTDPELAVELFIRPVDLPLMQMGQEVRFIFDGWPAIVFSGWPNSSFGTFFGEIVGIDNTTNSKGEYRIMVAPSDVKPWPEPLRPGSGAQGIALLDNVPLWYEAWRQLNSFTPDFYQAEDESESKSGIGKAPVRSVIK